MLFWSYKSLLKQEAGAYIQFFNLSATLATENKNVYLFKVLKMSHVQCPTSLSLSLYLKVLIPSTIRGLLIQHYHYLTLDRSSLFQNVYGIYSASLLNRPPNSTWRHYIAICLLNCEIMHQNMFAWVNSQIILDVEVWCCAHNSTDKKLKV